MGVGCTCRAGRAGAAERGVIACNPPYIPHKDLPDLDVSVRDYEPWGALDGGLAAASRTAA